jgi:hypothetical protein
VTATLLDRTAALAVRCRPSRAQAAAGLAALRRHWLFAPLLLAGLTLRVLTQLAYQPALLYIDSFSYLTNLGPLRSGGSQPIGYVLVLRPLVAFGGLGAVAIFQHVLGLGMAVLIYVVLLRRGAPRLLAALACAPVLLDAYQLQLEQNVMSDVVFEALVLGAVAALLWRAAVGWRAALTAGALLGAAAVVRLVGEPLVLLAVVFVPFAVPGWRRRAALAGVLAVGFAVPLAACMAYTQAQSGSFGTAGSSTRMLYGRVATVVDCAGLRLPDYERVLCPSEPVGQRMTNDDFANAPTSPLYALHPPAGMTTRQVLTDFNDRVLAAQPSAVATAIGRDAVKLFALTRVTSPGDVLIDRWRFTTTYPEYPPNSSVAMTTALGEPPPRVNVHLATFLRRYQLRFGYTPGPVFLVALAAGLLGAAGATRGARRSGLRAACLLATTMGAGVLLAADVFQFSWRYQVPAFTLLPLAGALGLTALRGKRRKPLAAFPDPVDELALADFRERYGQVSMAPVVVLIAAYNEAGGLGTVLAGIPARCGELAVDRLVVVDGGSDGTADVAVAHAALTCVAPVNRGQGAALRLGYALARAGGARYIVTTDADGQYDITELPLLLEPLLDDEADFVTGSRVLGRAEGADPVRRLGTRVYAALVSVLTKTPVTDTSFGFRAMRAELTAQVTLRQPQYQSSELLIGMLARGARVCERPLTMSQRSHGRSKKGNNLLYGARYARVVFGTWLRERRRGGFAPPAKTNRSNRANLTTNITP